MDSTDYQGSVVALTDGSGSVVDHYAYDSYGNTLTQHTRKQVAQPLQYIGGYHDTQAGNATGLYEFGIRYDDASQGRFTQSDSPAEVPGVHKRTMTHWISKIRREQTLAVV